MFAATDTAWAPWFVAHSDDKKRARLNVITHLLAQIPYEPPKRKKVELPERSVTARDRDRAALHPDAVLRRGGRSESLTRWVPGIRVARVSAEWLPSDVVAGVVLAAILVPQGMAYAELAGPARGHRPVHDDRLPDRLRDVRPVAGARARARLVDLAADLRRDRAARSPVDDPATAIALAGMLALLVGLVEIGLGLGKLGFVADLLSSEVQVGYMNGLGITIIVGQLPKLFGFSTDADGFVDEIEQFVRNIDETHATTLVVGVAVLVVLLVLPRVVPRIPAILVAVVGATVVSAVLDLAGDGVATVGSLPRGVPTPALPVDEHRRRRYRC